MKKQIILFLLAFPFVAISASASDTLLVSDGSLNTQNERWEIIIGDDEAYSKTEYEGASISVSKTHYWPEDSLYAHLKPTAWMRRWFRLDKKKVDKTMALEFGGFGIADIYIDGKYIGSIPERFSARQKKEYVRMDDYPVFFTLPDTMAHLISVRYENAAALDKNSHASWGFSMRIREADDFFRNRNETLKVVSVIMLPVGSIFATLFLLHILLFFFYRKDISNLYFALFNIGSTVLIFTIYLGGVYDFGMEQTYVSTIVITVASALACYSISAFATHLFSRRKWFLWVIAAASLLLAIASVFFYDAKTETYVEGGLAGLGILTSIYVAIIFITAIIKKVKGSWILGGGILFTIFFVFSTMFMAFISDGDLTTESNVLGIFLLTISILAVFSIPLSISTFLAWRYASTSKNLQVQLENVAALSEQTIRQEREKQHILQNQKIELEKQVAERTEEIVKEKQKSDDLLLNILPQEIADELKAKGESKAQHYEMASVLFTDFVNFTTIASKLSAEELLNELNINFTAFDRIMEKYGLEKIKTIGDAYLAVCGLPVPNERHAQNTIMAAQEIIAFVQQRKAKEPDGFDIRIGINSGPLVAGIIGVKKFAYDIWGDTVNIAARMEQNSQPGKINISENTYRLVKEDFYCTPRGKISVKGKGEMEMYFVDEGLRIES